MAGARAVRLCRNSRAHNARTTLVIVVREIVEARAPQDLQDAEYTFVRYGPPLATQQRGDSSLDPVAQRGSYRHPRCVCMHVCVSTRSTVFKRGVRTDGNPIQPEVPYTAKKTAEVFSGLKVSIMSEFDLPLEAKYIEDASSTLELLIRISVVLESLGGSPAAYVPGLRVPF